MYCTKTVAENIAKTSRLKESSTRVRSSVTNGLRVFVTGGDGRGAWSRRWLDLRAMHESDLGGADYVTAAQQSLVQRVSTFEIQCEQLEADLSEGKKVDLDLYCKLAANLRRYHETLGLQRVARPVQNAIIDHFAASPNGNGGAA